MRSDIVSRLLSGTLFTGIGNAVDKAANLISFVLIVRFLSKEEVGVVVIVTLVVNVYKIINNLLLDELWVAKTISSSEDSKEYLSCLSFTYSALISLLFLPGVFISFPVLIEKIEVFTFNGLSIYVSLIFLLDCVSGMLLRILQGWHEYKKIGLVQSTFGIGRLILVFILVVIFDTGIDGVLISYLISHLLTILLMLRILPFKIAFTFDNKEYKKLLVKGFPLSLNNLLTFSYNKIDRVIITSIVGVVGLAVYESATKIPQNIKFAYKSYIYVLFPNLSELYSHGNYSEIRNILNNSMRIITFFSCFICIFIFVFQDDITVLFFSSEYSEGAPVLAILSLAICVALTSNLMGISLVALGQPDKPVKINIVETITNIIANLVLIPIYGLIGAAFATLLSRCITNPVNLYFLKKTEISVDVSQYIKPLIVCVSLIIVNIYLSPKVFLSKSLLVLIYPITCYLLSICNKSDFVYIYKLISRYRASGNI